VGNKVMALKQMKPHYDKTQFGEEIHGALDASYQGFGPRIYHIDVEQLFFTQDLIKGQNLVKYLESRGHKYHYAVENYGFEPFYDFTILHPQKSKAFLEKLEAYLDNGGCHGDLYAKNVMFGSIDNGPIKLHAIDFGYAGVKNIPNQLHQNFEGKSLTFGETDHLVAKTIRDALDGKPFQPHSCFVSEHLEKQLGKSRWELEEKIKKFLCK
jgi:serine/threonine protein kinase